MDDETTIIPRPKTGLDYVNQVSAVHSVTVIVSALNEASCLVSNAHLSSDIAKQQSALREAQECAEIALSQLAFLVKSRPGNRVTWKSGYSVHYGTIAQVTKDGQYVVVPDSSETLVMFPYECENI
jgi:hypothetical protein